MRSLTELYLAYNYLVEIESVGELLLLTHLDLANNNVFRIVPLFKLDQLVYLKLSDNPICSRRDYPRHIQDSLPAVLISDPNSVKPYSKFYNLLTPDVDA